MKTNRVKKLPRRLVTVSDFSNNRTYSNPTKITVSGPDTTATATIIMTTINQKPNG